MKDTVVESDGKLRQEYLPAMYLDSSVVIDYWRVEGLTAFEVMKENGEISEIGNYYEEDRCLSILRETILKSEKRIKEVVDIRKRLLYEGEEIKVTLIVSPFALLELMKWHAEVVFKQMASEAAGVKFIGKRHPKQIGNYLKKTLKEFEKAKEKDEEQESEEKSAELKCLQQLISETWITPAYTDVKLRGLLQVDIVNFHLTIKKMWQEPSTYAYLQLGSADIMHILLAQHLGCAYIASFDEDFERVKDIIEEETGIEVLVSPDEILNCLSKE